MIHTFLSFPFNKRGYHRHTVFPEYFSRFLGSSALRHEIFRKFQGSRSLPLLGGVAAMKDFLNLSTCLVLAVLGALTLGDVAFTVASHGPSHLTSPSHVSAQRPSFASAQEVMGAKGMVCFGMGFGLLMAINQGLSRRNVSCKASFQQPGTIIVKEQDTDISKILAMNQFFWSKMCCQSSCNRIFAVV